MSTYDIILTIFCISIMILMTCIAVLQARQIEKLTKLLQSKAKRNAKATVKPWPYNLEENA